MGLNSHARKLSHSDLGMGKPLSDAGTTRGDLAAAPRFFDGAVRLRSRIERRPAEDVRVPERRRAVLLWSGPRARVRGSERCPPGVDRRAVGGIACIVPHRCPIGPRCDRVDVVAEELRLEVVLARSTRVARRTAMERAPRAEPSAYHVGPPGGRRRGEGRPSPWEVPRQSRLAKRPVESTAKFEVPIFYARGRTIRGRQLGVPPRSGGLGGGVLRPHLLFPSAGAICPLDALLKPSGSSLPSHSTRQAAIGADPGRGLPA